MEEIRAVRKGDEWKIFKKEEGLILWHVSQRKIGTEKYPANGFLLGLLFFSGLGYIE